MSRGWGKEREGGGRDERVAEKAGLFATVSTSARVDGPSLLAAGTELDGLSY